jgi:hypothetical protein
MPVDDQRAIAFLVGPEARREALQRRAVELVSTWAAGPTRRLPDGGRARCLVRVDGGPLAGTHFHELCPDLAPWDVALDVWAPSSDTLPVEWFRDLAGELGELIDLTRSSVMAGPQWRARKPPAALGLSFCVTRRPDLTHDAFVDHWRNEHAMLPLPMLRTFCQFYVDATRSAELAELAGLPAGTYDGIAEPTYRDVDEFRELTLDERVRVGARADELDFIDHTRSAATLFHPLWQTPRPVNRPTP